MAECYSIALEHPYPRSMPRARHWMAISSFPGSAEPGNWRLSLCEVGNFFTAACGCCENHEKLNRLRQRVRKAVSSMRVLQHQPIKRGECCTKIGPQNTLLGYFSNIRVFSELKRELLVRKSARTCLYMDNNALCFLSNAHVTGNNPERLLPKTF